MLLRFPGQCLPLPPGRAKYVTKRRVRLLWRNIADEIHAYSLSLHFLAGRIVTEESSELLKSGTPPGAAVIGTYSASSTASIELQLPRPL